MKHTETITDNSFSVWNSIAEKIHPILTCCIAVVWLVSCLFCKVLNLVPRHAIIVASILGNDHSRMLTWMIGIAETGMAFWILSGFKRRLCSITQIAVVAIMNIIEFFLAPDLLLWGRCNAVFAFFFMAIIFCNEFYLPKKISQPN